MVGENSTGKTTILAAIRTVEAMGPAPEATLNEDPFNLGAFDDIASYAPGRGGRAEFFRIGREGEDNGAAGPESGTWKVLATFVPYHGQPLLTKVQIEYGPEELIAERAEERLDLQLTLQVDGWQMSGGGGLMRSLRTLPLAPGSSTFSVARKCG